MTSQINSRHRKSATDQMGRSVEQGELLAPAVVLVNPQLGENIGAAARAMLNFGLTDLRLVAPRDGWPNAAAVPMAAGAAKLLDEAKVYDSTEEAVADLHYLLAATARRREMEVPIIGTADVGPQLRAASRDGVATGILFGPEKAGLTNADVALCDAILTYPINPAFQSLNLAQAVGVFSYIWGSSANADVPDVFKGLRAPVATRDDLVRLFEHLETELDRAGFFHPPEKRALMSQNIRAPLTRAQMTEQEVRTFRGIVKALAEGRGKARVRRSS